jgi:glycerate 2-kinase
MRKKWEKNGTRMGGEWYQKRNKNTFKSEYLLIIKEFNFIKDYFSLSLGNKRLHIPKKKRFLIAPNSYKECADSVEAAGLFLEFLHRKEFDCITAPLSDGGDGFLKVCSEKFELELLKYQVSSPYGSLLEVNVGFDKNNKTIFIESADVIGLKLIPEEKRNPMLLSSSGMGELLRKISMDLETTRFVIGIGGTAINDLGLGMLTELGLTLYDNSGEIIDPLPMNFSKIAAGEWTNKAEFQVEVVTDVENPLTGTKGATYIFGPQKGLSREEVKNLDAEFERITKLFSSANLIKNKEVLSGAGGGLAAGFQMFFNSAVKTSSDFILNELELRKMLNTADYVVTGEGSFDEQSLYGKAAGIIIKNTSLPVFLVCGQISKDIKLPGNVIPIELQEYFTHKEESLRNFSTGIKLASEEIIRLSEKI